MRTIWNKDKPWSLEVRNKISAKLKGRIPWNKGKKGLMPPNWQKGKHMDEAMKTRISNKLKGKAPWNKGKHLSEEHKHRIMIARQNAKKGSDILV